MIPPSEEEKKMSRILFPWLAFNGKRFVLKEGAPKEARAMYEIYLQKYGKYWDDDYVPNVQELFGDFRVLSDKEVK